MSRFSILALLPFQFSARRQQHNTSRDIPLFTADARSRKGVVLVGIFVIVHVFVGATLILPGGSLHADELELKQSSADNEQNAAETQDTSEVVPAERQPVANTPPESTPIIQTTFGRISGVRLEDEKDIVVFRGIPYAAPPLGELRWRAPQAPEKWDGVRRCVEFGNACPQQAWGQSLGRTSFNEDCLYLNVWTKLTPPRDKSVESSVADANAKRPVMVWIHGGGLNSGWAHQQIYDGTEFAASDVVVVSINYRLGPFGFFAHPDLSAESSSGVSGNYGLLDQIAALEWIRDNIGRFGGDSDNVTVFGQASGATCIAALCVSPPAEGLFHRAILQSPQMFGFITNIAKPNIISLRGTFNPDFDPICFAPAEVLGDRFIQQRLNTQAANGQQYATTLKAMRALSAEELVDDRGYYESHLVIDGTVVPQHPLSQFSLGGNADLPMIVGTTRHEGNFYSAFLPKSRATFEKRVQRFFESGSGKVLQLYDGRDLDSLGESVSDFVTDAWYRRPARVMLESSILASASAYQYEFAQPSRQSATIESPHCIDLPYTFGNLSVEASETNHSLSDQMRRYWVQFAKTGNPNLPELPYWPNYDESRRYLIFAKNLRVEENLKRQTLDVLDEAFAQRGTTNGN